MLKRLTERRSFLPILGATTIFVAVFVTLAFYLGWVHKWTADDGHKVDVDFPTTPQLKVGDLVRMDGVAEGEVTRITPKPGGRGATVQLGLKHDAPKVYKDARADLRWRTLLGGAFYVQVDPGTPRTGTLGSDSIPSSRTTTQVETDDVLGAIRADQQKGLQTMPGELSRALRDPRPLGRAADELARVAPSAATGLQALRGEVPDSDLRQLVTGVDSTVSAVNAPDDQLRQLVAGAASTVQVTSARDADLRSTLDVGSGTANQIRTTLLGLNGTLTHLDGLVDRLDKPAGQVAPTLSQLHPTLDATSRLLVRARPLLHDLNPAVRSLARVGAQGTPLLNALQPTFDRLDDKVLDYLNKPDPETGKPTSVMVGGTAAGFGGAAGALDNISHFIRFPASGGTASPSVYLPCKSSAIDPTASQLAECDSLQTALSEYLQYVPQFNLGQNPASSRKGG